MRKRLTAAFLCLCLLFTLLPATAFAEGETGSGAPQAGSALCEHHQQHDESCGYTEGTEEIPCTHEHDEDCYKLVTECVHEHTAECYPEESVSENTATPSEPGEAEPTECTHECSEESGCITEVLNCKHEHDEACGYVPATEGTPCTFVCEVCNTQDKDSGTTATPSDAQPEECTCETLCTEYNINMDCPVCGAEGADLSECEGLEAQVATPSNVLRTKAKASTQHDHSGWYELPTALNPTSGVCYINGGRNVLTDDTYLVGDANRLIFEGNVTLCLNGHTLNLLNGNTQSYCSIEVREGANVTICDCSGTPGKIVNYTIFTVSSALTLSDVTVDGSQISMPTVNGTFTLPPTGSLTMESGQITGAANAISALDGGIVNLNGGTVQGCVLLGKSAEMKMSGGTITGCDGKNGGGISVGGAITMSGGVTGDTPVGGGSCTISGGTIMDNDATNGGGVYVENGGSLTVEGDAQIINNNAQSGGGIYVADGGSCTINGGTISNNKAQSDGGGVYSEDDRLYFNSGTISGNEAQNGGGICIAGEYNSVTLGANNGTVQLTNNTAKINGGGMYLAEGTTGHDITGSNTLISKNRALNGGGVYATDGLLTMSGGKLSENTATENAGGIYAGEIFNGTGGEISGNKANQNGGGLYASGDTVQLKSDIKDNTATYYGGGVYEGAGRFFLWDGEISGNKAESGGGIFLSDKVTTANIIPDDGGSISITGNEATGTGGGIYHMGNAKLRLNATIQNNKAQSGGGVYLTSQHANTPWTSTIEGGEISGNTATSYGSNFYGNSGTFKVTGGTLKKSGSTVKSLYLSSVDGTVTGGYWDDPTDMVETWYDNKAVLIQGGYFSEKPGNVSGFYVDPIYGYMVVEIDETSGDSNYREGYPWAVYFRDLTAPKFTQHPQSQTVETGGSAAFTAEATHSGTITYFWQAQPKSSDPNTGEWYDILNYVPTGVSLPYTGKTLYLPNVAGSWEDNEKILDGGSGFNPADARFRCVAKGSNGVTSYSNTAELTVTSGTTPTITGVTVTPATATVQQGNTQQFSASVTGTGDFSQAVTWTVEGAASAGTTISTSGLLTVGADETAPTLTVRATAKGDNTNSGTAAVTVETLHVHDFGSEWKSDATNHWHECACGEKTDVAAHSGGTATCMEKAKCGVCGTEYGNLADHSYGTEWKSDAANHWHECACGAKADTAAHVYTDDQDTTCNVCGYERELSHTHNFGTEWKSDATNHWHECACGDKADVVAHVYDNDQDTTCNICGYERQIEPPVVTEYTVTFNPNGGSVSLSGATTKDGKLESLPTPIRSGHDFLGWYTTATGGTRVTTSTVFTADATLYAHWEKKQSSSGGGSSSSSSGGGSYTGPVGVYYADGRTEETTSDVTSGTWEQETAADGSISWRFKLADGSYAVGRWIKTLWNGQYLWYHMDAEGYLDSGWFTDTDGNIYYLHPLHDGNFGYMYTGDHVIDGIACSFSRGREQDGLPEGALKK